MNAEDAARIFEIFADRVAATMQTAAMAMLSDIRAAEGAPAIEPPTSPDFPDDGIPF